MPLAAFPKLWPLVPGPDGWPTGSAGVSYMACVAGGFTCEKVRSPLEKDEGREAGVPLSMGSGRSYLPGPVATLFSAVQRTARRGTRYGWLELPTSCSPPGCNLPGTTRGPS